MRWAWLLVRSSSPASSASASLRFSAATSAESFSTALRFCRSASSAISSARADNVSLAFCSRALSSDCCATLVSSDRRAIAAASKADRNELSSSLLERQQPSLPSRPLGSSQEVRLRRAGFGQPVLQDRDLPDDVSAKGLLRV